MAHGVALMSHGRIDSRLLRELAKIGEAFGPVASESQPGLPFYGATIDVDGVQDPRCPEIQYWGKATHVFDNVYRCYANVGGNLCIVEITVSRQQ